jgi:general secretion pathway protein G
MERNTGTGSRGFTLIEILIVMVIITILAGISVAMYGNSIVRAKEAVLKEDLMEMREAIDAYHADKAKWPASLDDLVADKYIRQVPVDPITNAADWRTDYAEADPGNPNDSGGISDVHSNSDQSSPSTQTPYSEW